ncbi:MAG TPA: hypothetical protein VJG30_02715 [Candidatus Nanoarchaeia archaeon]|nr:hypothetical protein [Candidatus Nanoarchaeia archaeon]
MRESLADNKKILNGILTTLNGLEDNVKKGKAPSPVDIINILTVINYALLDVIENLEENESGLATVNHQLALDIDKLDRRIKALEKK